MKVGIIGTGVHAVVRRGAIEAMPSVTLGGVLEALPGMAVVAAADPEAATIPGLDDFLGGVDAVFVTVPTAEHFHVAEAAAKRGVHLFLEWPPATSNHECQAMVRISEEASVEVGISRPLRFHPAFKDVPAAWRAGLILLHRQIDAREDTAWPRWLADALDLCCALARSSNIQRIDAEAVRNEAPWPHAVAIGLRFHNGTYAQISMRYGGPRSCTTLYASGAGIDLETTFDATGVPGAVLVDAETRAFLHALTRQRPVPVSILDGLHTMRLVERLMQKLR